MTGPSGWTLASGWLFEGAGVGETCCGISLLYFWSVGIKDVEFLIKSQH